MRRAVKEPLFHFLLIGAAFFGLYSLRAGEEPRDDARSRRIDVTRGDIERLSSAWHVQWQRPPTEDELRGLIDAHIREEVSVRQAIALGLDRDDTIVRRRLAQKFEFLTEDLATPRPPTSDELADFLEQHREQYEIPARVSFSHVYFSGDRRGGVAEEHARAALSGLRSGDSSGAEIGDPFLLDLQFRDKAVPELDQQFGADFARAVLEAEPRTWHGPVRSAFGWHLLRVHDRTHAKLPTLAEVEARVRRDWESHERQKANEEVFARLLARYEVVIEQPIALDSQQANAALGAGVEP